MWNTETEEEFLQEDMNHLNLNPPNPDAPVPAALRGEEESHIYENYSFNQEYSPVLPITHYRQDIVNSIESNSVCVIHGKFVFIYPISISHKYNSSLCK